MLLVIAYCIVTIYFMLLSFIGIQWLFQSNVIADETYAPTVRVSVIVVVRNEIKTIENLIQQLLKQDYPTHLYEIIVVDDSSNDGTLSVLKNYQTLQKIKLIQLADYINADEIAHKKKGIETAIKQSTGELILTTDGDCRIENQWIKTMAFAHEKMNAQFITAPVKIIGKTSIVEMFQSLDFTGMMALTSVGIQHRFLSMSNGANMAYTKQAYQAVQGFKHIAHTASGDDVLLLEKIKKQFPNAILFLKSKNAMVETYAESSLQQFVQQRIRWTSKSKFYSELGIKIIAMLVLLTACTVVISGVLSLFIGSKSSHFLIFLIIKSIADFVLLACASPFFNLQKLLFFFPVLEVVHTLYIFTIAFWGNISTYEWKDRIK